MDISVIDKEGAFTRSGLVIGGTKVFWEDVNFVTFSCSDPFKEAPPELKEISEEDSISFF